jgi:hypothetical protein
MFNREENKSKCRPEAEISAIIIPPAKKRCRVMRPTDEDTARSIVGEGVWKTLSRPETHLAGDIFYDACLDKTLPLRHTNPGHNGPNTYGPISDTPITKCPSVKGLLKPESSIPKCPLVKHVTKTATSVPKCPSLKPKVIP